MSRYGRAMAITKRILRKLGQYHEIDGEESSYGACTFASFAFYGCRAVVLQNCNTGGMAHILPTNDGKSHIDSLVRTSNLSVSDLRALVIAGYRPGPLIDYCREQGLTTDYVQIPGDENRVHFFSADQKDIIYRPSCAEVLLITRDHVERIRF